MEETQAKIKINFGALADPIGQQLHNQGAPVPPLAVLEPIQTDADAVTRLYLRSILPRRDVVLARDRLYQQIERAVAAAGLEADHA